MTLLALLLIVINLVSGSVSISASEVFSILLGDADPLSVPGIIVREARLPQTVTALLVGASLAVGGLLMQTLFRNPLAGPSILGISNGANLGVAIVMLGGTAWLGGSFAATLYGSLGIILGALLGSFAMLALIIYCSTRIRNTVMLLIIGMMMGYLASSVITILNYYSSADRVRAFVMWGMGDFSSVTLGQLPLFMLLLLPVLVGSLLLIKPLNALLLGEQYAANLGVNLRLLRVAILFVVGWLTAVSTAYCGPISFVGLAVPHVARMAVGSSNFRRLLPVTLLAGSNVALLCLWLSHLPLGSGMVPLNAITPLLGAPVILYVILGRRKLHYFQ